MAVELVQTHAKSPPATLLKKALPALTILMVTGLDDLSLLWQALVAGADGFLNKPLSETECSAAINLALAGGLPIARPIIQRTVSSFSSSEGTHLSELERAVLAGIAKGWANKEIAAELGVSVNAVENSARKIYRKLHVLNRAAAVSHPHAAIPPHSPVQR